MHVLNRRLLVAAVVAAAAGTRIVGPSIDVAAQGSAYSAAPSNEVPCDAFSKNPDGSWTARRPVTVKIGSSSVTVNASTYGRNAINVNGVDFVYRCKFNRCNIIIHGFIGCTLVDPQFIDCKWSVAGPAQTTFELLSALYKAGATDLIEATFSQIRGKSSAA